MSVINDIEIPFNHALYSKALLITNRSFKPTYDPQAINYKLEGSEEVRNSGLEDAGLKVSRHVLKALGYLIS